MRLLLTRPEPDAQRSAGRLRDLGHEVMVEPLLAVVVAKPPPIVTMPAAVVVTSRNGVRALSTWPIAAEWRALVPLFAIGKATAGAARDLGFAKVRSADGAIADLVALTAAAQDGRTGPLLYVAGRDRTGDIEGKLRASGFKVEVVEGYRMEPAGGFSPLLRQRVAEHWLQGALFYSQRTAATFAELAATVREADFGAVTAFALSQQVARPLVPLGFARIAVAAHPDESRLFELIGAG